MLKHPMAEEMSSLNIYSRVQTVSGWITDTKKLILNVEPIRAS